MCYSFTLTYIIPWLKITFAITQVENKILKCISISSLTNCEDFPTFHYAPNMNVPNLYIYTV